MKSDYADRYEGKGTRKCRFCGTSKGLIRVYGIYVCRRCFREHAKELGFQKYQ
ncbi:MAG: 30S ribosomal protein S14 [Candidatus Micrarchaeia archaeon]